MALSTCSFSEEFQLNKVSQVISLCKRRGFIFPSSQIYGGIKSIYDYGPLGVMLKNNISNLWWKNIVEDRDDVVGMDSAIIQNPKLWKTSGHLANFSDPLVDCRNCKARFRADKQPKINPDKQVTWEKLNSIIDDIQKLDPCYTRDKNDKNIIHTKVGARGYVCPECGSIDLSEERDFCGMFQSFVGVVDPIATILKEHHNLDQQTLQQLIDNARIYLRPETAQGIFAQFANILGCSSLKIPFGIAQIGKAFRNEVVTEHFIFRSCEFEQMELEFFCKPGEHLNWLEYWKNQRLEWFWQLAQHKDDFRARNHNPDELAHYADKCYDIEYKYPWGWDELEGIASRTDYDLVNHQKSTSTKLSYFDNNAINPDTGKKGYRYLPYIIEPSCGLTRALFCFLLDAYNLEQITDDHGKKSFRSVLNLHPLLAPYRLAILPLLSNNNHFCLIAKTLGKHWKMLGISVAVDINHKIGKRYAKHDEIGTPYALTIDHQTLKDHTFTLRFRESGQQKRINLNKVHQTITLNQPLYAHSAPDFTQLFNNLDL